MSANKKAAKKTAGTKKINKPESRPEIKPGKKTVMKATKNAGTNSSENLPDMKDVIQLATRLVSAQIASHSHHETTMNLFTEFRQLTLDTAIILKTSPENFPDLNSAASAAVDFMAKKRLTHLRSHKPRALQPMSHPDLDCLFQSAMRRAYVMLSAPFDPERVVFAEQIFEPSETLTEGAIRKRFIDFKWPDLKSGDPVIRLMKDVNLWFFKHLEDLRVSSQSIEGKESISATDHEIPITTRIEVEAKRLSWLLNQAIQSDVFAPEELSNFRALESAVSQFNNTRNGLDIGGAFRSMDACNRSNLILVMFEGKGPRNVEAMKGIDGEDGISDVLDNVDSSSRGKYRPWAIFRYLRLHGREAEDQLGKDLYNRLRAQRSELAPTRVPDIPGIEPAAVGFGPLHLKATDLLDELADNDADSDCAANSDDRISSF